MPLKCYLYHSKMFLFSRWYFLKLKMKFNSALILKHFGWGSLIKYVNMCYVSEPRCFSVSSRCCEAELHHLCWLRTLRCLHLHQLDHLYLSVVSQHYGSYLNMVKYVHRCEIWSSSWIVLIQSVHWSHKKLFILIETYSHRMKLSSDRSDHLSDAASHVMEHETTVSDMFLCSAALQT